MNRFLINILSYNRPNYLHQVLLALKANDLNSCDVILWQDGFDGPYQKDNSITLYQNCINTCKELFPDIRLHTSYTNKGIGQMYKEIKEYTFENYEAGIFLEDDCVPGPNYITILKKLFEQTKDNLQIGMLTAYGPDRFVSDLEQNLRYRELEHGIPSWGFLVGRKQYLIRKEILDTQYWPLVTGIDYRNRNNELILQKFVFANGFTINSTSQDTADTIAMTLCGQVKLSTVTRNATYIGASGEHFSPQEYDSGYYSKDKIFQYEDLKNIEFLIPSSERLSEINQIVKKRGFA